MRSRPGRGRAGVSARDDVALLLDLGGLAAQLAEVVELGPTDVTAGQHLDLLDDRGVHREGALHAHAEADLADGEGLADAAALTADDDALEDLDAGAVALDHPHVHLHGVTRAELGDVVAQRVGVERVQGVHLGSPHVLATYKAATSFGRTAERPGCPFPGAAAPRGEHSSTEPTVCSSPLLCH